MYHFIMNPRASSGKGTKVWKKLERILQEEQVEYQMHMLQSANDTRDFVWQLTKREKNAAFSEDTVHLVVLGGDGTLNVVLNGIADFEHTKLSSIRTGSGNDFARNVGVEPDAEQALLHLLHSPEEVRLDYGAVRYTTPEFKRTRRFLISTGVGYDADICEEVSRSNLKKLLNHFGLGKLVYVSIGIKQIFSRGDVGATIYFDNEAPMDIPNLFFVVGMIHAMEGGGVPFCPNADATDGILDVCLVQKESKGKLLLEVAMVYLKQHYRFRNVTAHKCRGLKVILGKPQWFHMDGETSVQVTEVEMKCKSGLRFVK